MNNKYIIIYDIASIDSTLAAAWVYQNLNTLGHEVSAYPASNKIIIDNNIDYLWVGVEPSSATLEYFLRRTGHERNFFEKIIPKKNRSFKQFIPHKGFFSENNLNGNAEYFFQVFTPFDTKNGLVDSIHVSQDFDVILTEKIIPDCVVKAVSVLYPLPTGPAWNVVKNAIDFQYNLCQLSVLDQACVYKNYTAAVETLAHGNEFNFTTADEKDEKIYLDFLKNVKRQISSIFETRAFVLDGHEIQVPTINVNQTLSPWVLKLLSNHYAFAITYEQRQNNSIFSIYSKIAGFDKFVLKHLQASKIPCRLSNQL